MPTPLGVQPPCIYIRLGNMPVLYTGSDKKYFLIKKCQRGPNFVPNLHRIIYFSTHINIKLTQFDQTY
jgi:hypothetical protein